MRRLRCLPVLCLAILAALVLPLPTLAAPGAPLSAEEERLLAMAIGALSPDSGTPGSRDDLPFAAQVALAAVALRRYADGHCGGTMAQVLSGMGLLPHDRTPAPDRDARCTTAVRAIRAALAGADPTSGAWIAVLPDSRGASPPGIAGALRFSCGGIRFYDRVP